MAFEDFWLNVANATRVRQRNIHAPDAVPITLDRVLDTLSSHSAWLTPTSVGGFDASDLNFLDSNERSQLSQWTNDFRALATLARNPKGWSQGLLGRLADGQSVLAFAKECGQLDYRNAANGGLEQLEMQVIEDRIEDLAKHLFAEIIQFLQFDRYRDAEAFRLGKQLVARLIEKEWPTEMADLRFETGPDSTGDPGLWVWAFVAESGEHNEEAFFKAVDAIKPALEPLARDVAPEGRVYLRFRSTLDQLEPEGVAA